VAERTLHPCDRVVSGRQELTARVRPVGSR
jgi:hypothetical protein